MLDENSKWFCILVCNFFSSKHYRSTCQSRLENLDLGQYPIHPIKLVNLVVSSPCEMEPYNIIFSGPTTTYFFIEKSCLLTDKIKKSSINTAPNGRMPAIRLLKGLQRNSVMVLHNLLLTCKQTSKQKVQNEQWFVS